MLDAPKLTAVQQTEGIGIEFFAAGVHSPDQCPYAIAPARPFALPQKLSRLQHLIELAWPGADVARAERVQSQ